MLQPKRTKYRKQHKMRNRGIAYKGSTISFGSFDYLLKSNANPKEVAEIVKKVNHHKTATSHLEIV